MHPASEPSSPDPADQLTSLLVEASRTSYDELISRVRFRDNWLKLQLVLVVVLGGLSLGFGVLGVTTTTPSPGILALAIPSSFVLLLQYLTEDRLVWSLSRYRARLGRRELAGTGSSMELFESSEEIEDWLGRDLRLRSSAVAVAFVLIPVGLEAYRLFGSDWTPWAYIEAGAYLTIVGAMILLIRGLVLRRR